MRTDDRRSVGVLVIKRKKSERPSRAVIYCRISKDAEKRGLGVKRQETMCREKAKQLGWPVVAVYVDNDLSAYAKKPRPKYERLLREIESGAVDGVVIARLDRIYRRPIELEQFMPLADAKGTHLATVSGSIDLSTAEGRSNARNLSGAAAYESEVKSERLSDKHLELAKKGQLSGGGTRPFGYENDRVTIRPKEATMIRDAARRILSGESLRAVCREWNGKKVRTTGDGLWYGSALARVLKSGRLAGWREHHHELIAKATWPAIIDLSTSKRLRAKLMDPDRRLNAGARRYLLTGFLRCALCKSPLVARPRGDGARCYVCAKDMARPERCGKLRRLSEPVEEFVVRSAITRLDSPDLARAITDKQRKGAKGDHRDALTIVDECESDLEQLAADLGQGRISRREWIAAREPMERRRDAAAARLGAEKHLSALDTLTPGVLRESWPALTFDRQRAILSAAIDRIVLHPALKGRNVFDPSRVKIEWKF